MGGIYKFIAIVVNAPPPLCPSDAVVSHVLCETILRFRPRGTTNHLGQPLNLAVGVRIAAIDNIANEVHGVFKTSSAV